MRAVDQELTPRCVAGQQLAPEQEKALRIRHHASEDTMVAKCDVVIVDGAEELTFEERKRLLELMKHGSYLIEPAAGRLTQALNDNLFAPSSNHGYKQELRSLGLPRPQQLEHAWRATPRTAVEPAVSGDVAEAQMRYEAEVTDVMTRFVSGQPLRRENLIVDCGRVVNKMYML